MEQRDLKGDTSSARTKKTFINTIVDIGSYFISTVLKFVVRTVFITTIGVELLGLNGLFSSIVAMFSLADLGFGTAIGALLYKPIADDDTEKIKSLIHLTKKIFIIVGSIIIVAGIAIVPFIHYFIKDNVVPLSQIRVYFLLYVAFSAVSYFNAHKTLLIGAAQKKYIEKNFIVIFNIVVSVFQIVSLYVFKSFALFLSIQAVFAIIQNVVISFAANKIFPYLKEKKIDPLPKAEKKDLLKKTIALAGYKVGGIVVASTDNLLMSGFFGINVVAQYANYTLIITSITILAYQIVGGTVASVGNLWVKENKEKVYEIFKIIDFLQYWLSVFCSVCLCVLIEPFIKVWLGESFLLGLPIVIVLVTNFYLSSMRSVVCIFKDSKGLFLPDKYKPIFEAIINLGVSLLLLHFFGIIGIFLGTTISLLAATVWVEPKVLFKHGFEISSKSFFLKYLLKFILCVIITSLTYFVCSFLGDGIAMFICKMLICLVLPNVILFLIFFRTKEFKYYANLIKKLFSSIKNKIKKRKGDKSENI